MYTAPGLISSIQSQSKERRGIGERLRATQYFNASLQFLQNSDLFPNGTINVLASRLIQLIAGRNIQPFIAASDTMSVRPVEDFPSAILVPFDLPKLIEKNPGDELTHVVMAASKAIDLATGHAVAEQMDARSRAYGAECLLFLQEHLEDFQPPESLTPLMQEYPHGLASLPPELKYEFTAPAPVTG